MSASAPFQVRVTAAELLSPSVRKLRLELIDGTPLPPYSAGAHAVLTLKSAQRTLRNAYSLLGDTRAGGAYEVAVQRSAGSRGGSAYVHDGLKVGAELGISPPLNLFPLNHTGRHHILIAGGIGITPIHAMAAELAERNASFELHYAVRDHEQAPFADDLALRHGARFHLYAGTRGERLSLPAILADRPLGTHIYVCGPERLIAAVMQAGEDAGWPHSSLHAEHFLTPAGGEPFAVRLARSGLTITVGAHQSLLEAIEEAGVDAPYLCRGGACGQCETTVLERDGELLHHDHILTPAEQASGTKIMICMSRLKGRELVLDL